MFLRFSRYFLCLFFLLHSVFSDPVIRNVQRFEEKVFLYKSRNKESRGNGNYESAKNWCHEMEGELPSVHSQQELEALLNHGPDERICVWLGASWNTESNVGAWDDGSAWGDLPIANSPCRDQTLISSVSRCGLAACPVFDGSMILPVDTQYFERMVCQFSVNVYLQKYGIQMDCGSSMTNVTDSAQASDKVVSQESVQGTADSVATMRPEVRDSSG